MLCLHDYDRKPINVCDRMDYLLNAIILRSCNCRIKHRLQILQTLRNHLLPMLAAIPKSHRLQCHHC